MEKQYEILTKEIQPFRLTLSTGTIRHPFVVTVSKNTPRGKSPVKVLNRYGFRTPDSAEKFIDTFILNEGQRIADRNARKALAAAVNAAAHFTVGDVVVNSWGYEQTNVDFYVVTKVTARQITVVRCGNKSAGNHGFMSDTTVPDVGRLDHADTRRLTIKQYQTQPEAIPVVYIVSPNNYYSFSKWDGKPCYRSWYA